MLPTRLPRGVHPFQLGKDSLRSQRATCSSTAREAARGASTHCYAASPISPARPGAAATQLHEGSPRPAPHPHAREVATTATSSRSSPSIQVTSKPHSNSNYASSASNASQGPSSSQPPTLPALPSLSPSPPPGSPPGSPPGDLRLDLWLSLLQAGAAQLTAAATATGDAVASTAARLQRLATPPPPGFPAGPSGDATVSLLSDPLSFLTSSTQQFGPVVGLLLGGERVVLVTGREEARTVLIEQAGTVYVKEGTAFFPGSSLAGNGLLVSDGAVWQRQRRLSNPAFRRAAVDAYSAAMVAATQEMMERVWRRGGVRDVYEDYNELTLRVTLDALFGFGAQGQGQGHGSGDGAGAGQHGAGAAGAPPSASSYAGPPDEAQTIVSAVEKAFTFFTQRAATGFVIPEWLPTWDNLEFAAAVQQLDRVVYGMIARRREQLAEAAAPPAAPATFDPHHQNGHQQHQHQQQAVPSDLLTSLLLARDEDGSGMSDGALRDELMTLLVAGQETSAILLGWASALLAAHPEVQRRAAEEVTEVLGSAAMPTAASVRQMPYLEAVVLEALRLYSPAYMVGRCARAETSLGPYVLPAGTTVLVSPYVMHRDPTVWEEPEAFRPERWQELQARDGYQGFMSVMSGLGPNGSYLPFGGGPRNCIGTGFAMVEALLVLAAVLQRYQLLLPGATAVGGGSTFPKAKPLLTLRPEAVRLRIVPRR